MSIFSKWSDIRPSSERADLLGSTAQKRAQNFYAIYKLGQKHPIMLPSDTETFKKHPKIVQNF